ncbi:D-alanyl-D-alanine carboxypeptidase [Streptomyces sp. ASQP_92]|uniref:D-alanyl-D-alanine carboxypeptidase n=1 Tax=Streptomyces sp. ASQP_92 TaxID=2979116 RepID=UPI0021C1CC3E|nr:D-alanyl-D-alanine carboxypeptidase [Streptomyces sp. ASQP_92]MCT9088995.1 D-alanyl-D-alanine carboxypeptidase [Streptomyces sp. ASQP_92]
MNEKNSTKAADVSGASAAPSEDGDAVRGTEAAESTQGEAAESTRGETAHPSTRSGARSDEAGAQEAPEPQKAQGAYEAQETPNSGRPEAPSGGGTDTATRPDSAPDEPATPNSSRSKPTWSRAEPADDADRADRADKTLVGASATPPQDSARPDQEAAALRDDVREDDEVDPEPGAVANPVTGATPEPRPSTATGAGREAAPDTGAGADADPEASGVPTRREPDEDEEAGGEHPEAGDSKAGDSKAEAPKPQTPKTRASESPAKPSPPTTPAPCSEAAPAVTPGTAEESAKEPNTPSWAARSGRKESDSEQTSEFVALKPDLPHPAPTRRSVPAPPLPSSAKAPGRVLGEPETTREFAAPPGDDRTMALTRPAGPGAVASKPTSTPTPTPETASGTGDAGGPPPPLDLLAQLTNTPPKPETVARTVGRRIKIWGTLVALLAIVLVTVQALRPLPAPKLVLTGEPTHTVAGGAPSLPWPTEGQAVVDIDGLGRMGSYGEMRPLPIGSVAKVMTAYLILRDHPLKVGEKGPMVAVDQKAQDDYTNGVKERESVVEVKAGQRLPELEALQAVMLPSANNVARLLARWDATTEEAFIKKMNDTARQFGMTNTTYTDASGLVESTVSTAEDQVKLAKRAMADPVFRQIAKLPAYTSTTTSGGGTVETARTQSNFNKLVPLYGVVGIKTGSTTKAGGNLLFAAEKTVGSSKQLIVGAVFGQHKRNIIETATAASKNLILAAGKALRDEMVVKKGDVVGRVEDGLGGTVPVVATKDLSVPVWTGASVGITLTDGGKKLPHTAKAGTEVGTLTVGGGIGEVKVPVALKDDLAEPSFTSKLTRLG